MLYVALVAIVKVTVLMFVVWRLWLARNREAHRADANARGWADMRALHAAAAADGALYKMQRDTATIRLEEITKVITRRPPRRKWLRIAYRVAVLADLTTRGKRLSA